MVQTLKASDVTLGYLVDRFGLTQTSDSQFFQEWQAASAEVAIADVQRLDRVKSNFQYLIQKPPFLESAVQMVVISPLLDLAGFYQPPFRIQTEAEVAISSVDPEEETLIRGKLDILIITEGLWVVVIESKMNDFSLTKALPQTLTYMLANPQPYGFGLIANGSEFVFLKLQQETPTYSLSRVFSALAPGDELVDVLLILKHLGQVVISRYRI